MKLLERYSTQCSLKIDKPFLYKAPFPILFEKFITIQNSSGMEAKNYSYYQEVINLIAPELQKNDINIIQLGDGQTPNLQKCVNLGGKTTIAQTNYILSKALLHAGNDSFIAHLSGHLNIPLVALYGSTSPKNHGPSFGDKDKQILIESHRNGNLPSFASNEQIKSIDLINPELVANAILKLLNLPQILRETLFIGDKYNAGHFEFIVDSILHPSAFPEVIPVIRLDYEFNENMLAANLRNRKFHLYTNSPINLDLLKNYKVNIIGIILEIKSESKDLVNFISKVQKLGIPYKLISYLSLEEINNLKLDYFDFGIIEDKKLIKKQDIKNFEKITAETKSKTNKFLLSKDKIYLNKDLREKDISTPNFENNVFNVDLDSEDFLKNIDHYYIYNE